MRSGPAARRCPSPNHDARAPGAAVDILLLHYTGMPEADGALAWLCDPASRVSTHYFVFEDGRIVASVPEERRAWHAGAGTWRGRGDVNSRSIGVEIANPGHEWGYRPFPDAQIEAVTALAADVMGRHGIEARNVLAHSDIAPERKIDPGELFPWERLARAGIGLWVPLPPPGPDVGLRPGDSGGEVAGLQAHLASFGYGIEPTGFYDPATEEVVLAFQRHFRPERIDGRADPSTRATLTQLLDLVKRTERSVSDKPQKAPENFS